MNKPKLRLRIKQEQENPCIGKPKLKLRTKQEQESPCSEKPKLRLRAKPKTLRERLREQDFSSIGSKATSKIASEKIRPQKLVRYMIQYWNEKADTFESVPKRLNEIHGGNQTKKFKETVKVCNLWLKGKLFNSIYGVAPNYLNGNRPLLTQPGTYEDFTLYVDRFCKILHDRGFEPKNKEYIWKHATMRDFIAGNTFTNAPSLLMEFCLEEPQPVYEYQFEEFHLTVKKAWLRFDSSRELTATDFVNFDKYLKWFTEYLAKKHKITRPILIKENILQHLARSIEFTWKTKRPSTSYLPSAKYRQDFIEYLDSI